MSRNNNVMTKKEVTQLSYDITGSAIKVHRELDPGFLESVYEKCLKYELIQDGYGVEQQIMVPVVYETDAKASRLAHQFFHRQYQQIHETFCKRIF